MNNNTTKIFNYLEAGEFSLSQVEIYKQNAESLAFSEYKRCNTIFETRFALRSNLTDLEYHAAIMELMSFISVKELPITKELETLAIKTISELYDVPEHIVFNAELGGDLGIKFKKESVNLSPSAKEALVPEIKKRIILNGLAHGSSIHIWKTIHHLVKNEIQEDLFKLYDKYTDLVGVYAWKFLDIKNIIPSLRYIDASGTTGATITQGFEQLDFSDEENPEIKAKAINFPVLLHELNKGVVDYLITKGINQDLSEDELTYVFEEADKYEHELWHQYLSPSIWVYILKNNRNSLAEEISRLAQMDYEDLNEYLNEIING